jgi:hypothetical protein
MTLVKLDVDGDTIWTKHYVQDQSIRSNHILQTTDENLLMVGYSERDSIFEHTNIVLLKTDLDGNPLWSKTLLFAGYQSAVSIIELRNSDLLLTGSQTIPGEHSTLLLLNIDSEGNINWQRSIGPTHKSGSSTVEDENGDLITCGHVLLSGANDSHLILVKTDQLGNILWEKEYGEFGYSENPREIKRNSDGDFVICGYSIPPGTSYGTDNMVLKIDSEGELKWCHFYDDQGANRCSDLIIEPDNVNIITGHLNGDIFMTRIDKDGNAK